MIGDRIGMKKLLALLTATVMMIATGSVSYAEVPIEDEGAGGTGTALTYYEIPKDIVLFNTTGTSIYEPNIIYTYKIENANPQNATIKDKNNITETVKKGVTGLVKIQGSDKTGYIGQAGTGNVNLVFDAAFTLKATNNEGSHVTTESHVTTRKLKLVFDVTALKNSEGQYPADAAGIYRYKLSDITPAADLTSAGIRRNNQYDKVRYLDIYVEWADDSHTTPQVYGIVLYKTSDGKKTANEKSKFVYDSTITTHLKVTGYNVESEMRWTGDSPNPTSDEYHTYNLTVSKTVMGDSADTDHAFPISVIFTNTQVTNRTAFYSTGAFSSSQLIMGEGACSINEDYSESGPKLKHGESFTMIGLPALTSFVVNEQNDATSGYNVTIRDDTKGTYLKGTESGGEEVNSGSDTNLSEAQTLGNLKDTVYQSEDICIINEISDAMVAPTGITSRHTPFLLILVLSVILLGLAGGQRKRIREVEDANYKRKEPELISSGITSGAKSHVRQKNSLWVKHKGYPPNQGMDTSGSPRPMPKANVSPQQSKKALWDKGPPGRGDPMG